MLISRPARFTSLPNYSPSRYSASQVCSPKRARNRPTSSNATAASQSFIPPSAPAHGPQVSHATVTTVPPPVRRAYETPASAPERESSPRRSAGRRRDDEAQNPHNNNSRRRHGRSEGPTRPACHRESSPRTTRGFRQLARLEREPGPRKRR